MTNEKKNKGELIEGHEYDDIKELNNGIPPILSYIFIATIIFSIFYVVRYHLLDGPTQEEEYTAEVEAAKEKYGLTEEAETVLPEEWLASEEGLKEGEKKYKEVCAVCHGQQGEGTVGPNLTDKYWKTGGDMTSIMKVLNDGVAAMPPFKSQMSKEDLFKVGSYMNSLQGTNPENAKEPEGELYEGE